MNVRRAILSMLLAGVSAALVLPAQATPLHALARNGDVEGISRYVALHEPEAINAVTRGGVTALHLAAAMNHLHASVLLIRYGADVNATTDNGFTPLHWASSRNALDVAEYLLVSGANIDAATRSGITPIHWGASNNATNVVELLLAFGANYRSTSGKGLRPLHWAVEQQATDASILLAASEILTEEPDDDAEAPIADAAAQTTTLEPVALSERLVVPIDGAPALEFVWLDGRRIWMAKYEVMNAQFRRFIESHRSGTYEGHSLDDDAQPCVSVTWHRARRFCAWMTEHHGFALPDGYVFRLPTESEWIHAASAGDDRLYPWGDTFPPAYGNFSDASARAELSNWRGIRNYDDGTTTTAPVAESGANEWGLHGLGGNVWEWCEDRFESASEYRIRKGGSWHFDSAPSLKVAYRGFDLPTSAFNTIGFRVVAAKALDQAPPGTTTHAQEHE